MAKQTPLCPTCGKTTIAHCVRTFGGACDWWECRTCHLVGAGKHHMPADRPRGTK